MPVAREAFQLSLRTKIPSSKVEAYNWVVSICLKYVSLPWHMVNSLRRGASEPWAWREFYNTPSHEDQVAISSNCSYYLATSRFSTGPLSKFMELALGIPKFKQWMSSLFMGVVYFGSWSPLQWIKQDRLMLLVYWIRSRTQKVFHVWMWLLINSFW